MNKITYWEFSIENERASAIDMRDRTAINFHKKILSNDKIFKKWVYNFRYDCLKLVKKIIGREISGIILDVGAGTGIYSSLTSKIKGVEKVYALDYSKICVEELMTFIIKKFNLNELEENKIFPVIGSFNNIKLPDNSVDFVIAMGALHHSENREKTLGEIFRVLKIGGYLIACERANSNVITNRILNFQLDAEYKAETKAKMGYDASKKYTRRMNSEHHPMLAEWEYLLTKLGFDNRIFWFLYFSKKKGNKVIRFFWHTLGKLFFKIFGERFIKRNFTQLYHIKIPYYPWFSKSKDVDDILIVSKKEPYIKMP